MGSKFALALVGLVISLIAVIALNFYTMTDKSRTETPPILPDYFGANLSLGEQPDIGDEKPGSNPLTVDEVLQNPSKFEKMEIKIKGYVVKNVGAFFGPKYMLQSPNEIKNFKSVAESSQGIALYDPNIEDFVAYIFDGHSYAQLKQEEVVVSAVYHINNPPPPDGTQDYLEVRKIESLGSQKLGRSAPPNYFGKNLSLGRRQDIILRLTPPPGIRNKLRAGNITFLLQGGIRFPGKEDDKCIVEMGFAGDAAW